MKNKKYIIIFILLVFLIVGFYAVNYNSIDRKISRDLEIYLPNKLNFEYEDSHHWFLGDGITLAESDLNEKQISLIIDKSDTDWGKSPIPTEIKEVIYEPSRDMSEVKNGYWIFKNRTPEGRFEHITRNYSLGVIDLDTNTFYYIKFDS